MSGFGNDLPARDSLGRFIRRPDTPSLQPAANRVNQPELVATPLPICARAQPCTLHLQQFIVLPPNSPEPRTPTPNSLTPPTTPVRPTATVWNNGKSPLLAPLFYDHQSQDSLTVAPARTPPSPNFYPLPSTVYTESLSEERPPASQLNPAFAPAAAVPRPLLLPTFSVTNNRHVPHAAPPMAQHVAQRPVAGPAAMPAPRSSRAPYFSGSVNDSIEDFLRDYEVLAESCGLTNRQNVETVTRYTKSDLRDFWKSQDGYIASDWRDLKQELLKLYAGASALRRYSERKLQGFARDSARSCMRSEEDVVKYYRHFIVLCKPLLDSQRLTTGERNKIFWEGFHKRDRAEMHTRLIAEHTRQPAGVSFDYLDVFEVAKAILGGHDTDSESDSSSDDHRSTRSRRSKRTREHRSHDRQHSPSPTKRDRHYRHSDTRYSPSPEHRARRRSPSPEYRDRHSDVRQSPAPDIETRVVRFKEPLHSREDEREVDELMSRMNGLSTHDKAYAVLYGRCALRFPSVAQVLPKPSFAQSTPSPTSTATFSVQTPPAPAPPQQPWTAAAHHLPAPLPPSTSNSSSFFRPRVRPDGCAFCLQSGHRVRECPSAQEYVRSGRALVLDDRLSLPNGQPIPNSGSGRGLKHGIDTWLAAQAPVNPTSLQQVSFARDTPPHFPAKHDNRVPSACIEEVTEAHIVQVVDNKGDPDSDDEDFFQVYATEKKKRDTRRSKLPELQSSTSIHPPSTSTDPPTPVTPGTSVPSSVSIAAPPPTPTIARTVPQYRYQSTAEDQRLVSELESWLMEGKLSQTTPAHILAASPVIRKDLVERLRVRRVETSSYEEAADLTNSDTTNQSTRPTNRREPAYSLPLREIDVQIGDKVLEAGVIDPGSQIIVIREDLAREVGATINTDRLLQMEGANGATNWTLGCAEYLPMRVGNVSFEVHAHIIERAPFRLLLGRPFQHALLCRIEDLANGEVEVSVQDPANPSCRTTIPSRPRKVQVASVRILTLSCCPQSQLPYQSSSRSSSQSVFLPSLTSKAPSWQPNISPSDPLGNTTFAQAYKKVSKKVRPVPASLPEDFRTVRRIPSDPLLTLPALSPNPPDFVPGTRLTQERLDALGLNHDGFLLPEELKLLHHVLKLNEFRLAWSEAEKGRFRDDYFSPVKIPVVKHVPWVHRNYPIPPGILDDVIQIFRDKFTAGVYEHSDASYRSPWFCVKKKNGSLRIVHDLQPLNAITIRNSGIPPLADQLIETMAGRSCYTMLDLFVGYDHRTLDVASRDLTTFQSPIGTVRLTSLPMGWTNAVTIFHEDVTFILESEIPHVAWPFVDDCSIKGPATRFETDDGGYETLPDNPGIRKFIWQHLVDVHHILHRLHHAGATVSTKKLFIAVPEVVILGHKCNYDGRVPDDSKVARIRDWPVCKTLTDVRAFLGTTGFMRVWIRNYSSLA